MPVMQKGEALYAFWGAAFKLILGQDPLGQQTTSEATYSRLLPGVTNQTNRIRYYGFYCWLLEFYFQREEAGNSTEQNRFIRRAELLLVLMMQQEYPTVQQITGSRFAQNYLIQTDTHELDLIEGADLDRGTIEGLYWKHPSGGFGQYYYGALSLLGLATTVASEKDQVKVTLFQATQSAPEGSVSGKDLAEAFDAALTDEIRDLAYRCIKMGAVTREELTQLAPYFAITQVSSDSVEWDYYRVLLFNHDYQGRDDEEPTYYRRETIEGLLRTAQATGGALTTAYIHACYQQRLGSPEAPATETQMGWYSYQLNEHWQFACGSIFWGVLHVLEQKPGGCSLSLLVEDLREAVIVQLVEDYDSYLHSTSPLQDCLDWLPDHWTEEHLEDSIHQSIKSANDEADGAAVLALGFRLLFLILKKNQDQLLAIQAYLEKQQVIRDGSVTEGLTYIQAQADLPLADFIKRFILQRIVYRHQEVAFRKMGSGNQSTQKFILEDSYIRYVENFAPRHTSPRMEAVKNLLYDLQLMDEQGQPTPLATQSLSLS